MWMLPFVTKRDLEQAAQTAHVSLETRNLFLNKMLSEHSQPGIRLIDSSQCERTVGRFSQGAVLGKLRTINLIML